MAEQKIVETVRDILIEKGYPSPAHCSKADRRGIKVYSQDDYKFNLELEDLLKHSSKNLKHYPLSSDYGKPEFIIINEKSNLAIVIECKAAKKINVHISTTLKENNLLLIKSSNIQKYAVDGAIHYSRFLSKKYDVIAIGVSGIVNSNELNVTTYYWGKGKEVYKKVEGEQEYIYGPFVNLKINEICSWEFYCDFVGNKSKEFIKSFNEEQALKSAKDLNIELDASGVGTTVRAILVSGLLLALKDKTFEKTYEDKEISCDELLENLNLAIERVVNDNDIQDSFKRKTLKDQFNAAFNQNSLLENNAQKLRIIIEKLHKSVFPCINGDYAVDIIGKFYHEFLKYAKGDHNSGIKLTPTRTTKLFCELADLKVSDIVLDTCLGTGGFLISAMSYMYNLADHMTEEEINDFFEEKVEEKKISIKDIETMKKFNLRKYNSEVLNKNNVKDYIKKNQLVGCENDGIMYTLGCSNMILRGDGKSNIIYGDCIKNFDELKKFNATVGFMNPPYSDTAYKVLDFVDNICKCVKKGSTVVVIVPTSAAHSDENKSLRNKILKSNSLVASMSMPLNLFSGIADTVPCILVLKAGIKHDFDNNVYFGNWKNDGYYWHRTYGMIPDLDGSKTGVNPEKCIKNWLKSFKNKNLDDKYGIWRKLTIDSKSQLCHDEWLWEYYVEPDYTNITKEDFEKTLKDFVFYQIQNISLTNNIQSREDKNED